MDGSRRRRHRPTAQARWLAVWRTARWARRFLGRPIPPVTALAAVVLHSLG